MLGDSSSQMQPTMRASKADGTSVGRSRVPAPLFLILTLKGSGSPASSASSSLFSKPVARSRGSGSSSSSFTALLHLWAHVEKLATFLARVTFLARCFVDGLNTRFLRNTAMIKKR
uniref:Uncharacterized protein n=1 Tax=Cacopsylla melanoneura TaxID=428564 RepID=A0A8D8UH18_9HEMI